MYIYLNDNNITGSRRFCRPTGLVVHLWSSVRELAHYTDNAKVRKIDSGWRCVKYEIFRITLLQFRIL